MVDDEAEETFYKCTLVSLDGLSFLMRFFREIIAFVHQCVLQIAKPLPFM